MTPEDIHKMIGIAMSAKQDISEMRKLIADDMTPQQKETVFYTALDVEKELEQIFEILQGLNDVKR